jgi:Glycosyl hydrolase family 26
LAEGIEMNRYLISLRLATAGLVVASMVLSPTIVQAATHPKPILLGIISQSDQSRMATEHAIGKRSALIVKFSDWDAGLPSLQYLHNSITSHGAVPVITTGPTGYAPLARVISGAEDAKIGEWARSTRAFGHPILFRLMAEMNGSWEPWSTGVNGNKPGEYVQAWRHIVDIFRADGATNVRWVFNPNRTYKAATRMRSVWPGASYVDWIGLDIYNFNTPAKGGWLTFDSMMKPSIKELRAVAGQRKPFMINEIGCAAGAKKPAWLKTMFSRLPAYGVKAVMYFDFLRKADWRLTAKPANLAATRYAVRRNGITGAGDLSRAAIERIVLTGSP